MKFVLADGQEVYISEDTRASLAKRNNYLFLTGEGTLSDLEYHPLNFEHFEDAKTSVNVNARVRKYTEQVGMKSNVIWLLTADGASNASIGSIVDFKAATRNDRSTNQEFEICAAHQDQRSTAFSASGKGDFVENKYPELSALLDKNHKAQVRHIWNFVNYFVIYLIAFISYISKQQVNIRWDPS